MNSVRSKVLENYRIMYDPYKRVFELRKAWPSEDDYGEEILYSLTEKALIATLLDLLREEV